MEWGALSRDKPFFLTASSHGDLPTAGGFPTRTAGPLRSWPSPSCNFFGLWFHRAAKGQALAILKMDRRGETLWWTAIIAVAFLGKMVHVLWVNPKWISSCLLAESRFFVIHRFCSNVGKLVSHGSEWPRTWIEKSWQWWWPFGGSGATSRFSDACIGFLKALPKIHQNPRGPRSVCFTSEAPRLRSVSQESPPMSRWGWGSRWRLVASSNLQVRWVISQ